VCACAFHCRGIVLSRQVRGACWPRRFSGVGTKHGCLCCLLHLQVLHVDFKAQELCNVLCVVQPRQLTTCTRGGQLQVTDLTTPVAAAWPCTEGLLLAVSKSGILQGAGRPECLAGY
jgi:hypothetical protein